MPKTGSTGPTRWLCPQCAYDLYPRMSTVDIAAHAVHHRQAHHTVAIVRGVPITRTELEDYVVDLVRYIGELEAQASRWRGQIADRDDIIEALEADLDFERRQRSPS